jgi:hypothetical protein
MTSTAVGLVETGLKNCLELRINIGVSGLRLPLLHQNCPPEPLYLGCLCLGQVLQLSTLGNSDNSVHPVHSSRDLTVLYMILCSGTRATGSGLLLSRTRILMLSVPSSSSRTLTKRLAHPAAPRSWLQAHESRTNARDRWPNHRRPWLPW